MHHILWVDDKYAKKDSESADSGEESKGNLRESHEKEIKRLNDGGIKVVKADSTQDALAKIRQKGLDAYHGIISDMEREEGDGGATNEHAGLDLLRQVRQQEGDISKDQKTPFFIFTTGKHTAGKYEGDIGEDNRSFITNKPFELYEHVSREVLKDEKILLRQDPKDASSGQLTTRQNRFVYSDQAFFKDEAVQNEMDGRRPAIEFVRAGWEDTEKLLAQILRYPSAIATPYRLSLIEYAAKIAGNTYAWDEAVKPETAISLLPDYTSRVVYDTVYGIMNGHIYRVRDKKIGYGDLLLATYILEHINIALYHHVAKEGDFGQGNDGKRKYAYPVHRPDTTYRGIQIPKEEIDSLKDMAEGKSGKGRAFTHPLSLVSTSYSLEQASRFLKKADSDEEEQPALFKTYILGLPEKYLSLYNKYFNSTVSSICAVDIQDRSYYPDEEEVLFRGPFFEMLGYHTPGTSERADGDFQQFDAVTIDANRDHPSTYAMRNEDPHDFGVQYGENKEPEDLDDQARDLFGLLVRHWRAKACKAYHTMYNDGRHALISYYDQQIKARKKDVEGRFREEIPSVDVPTSVFEN